MRSDAARKQHTLPAGPNPDIATGTPELIDHSQARFHEARRRDLPELVAQARKLESQGLAPGLLTLQDRFVDDLVQHVPIEDDVLFARCPPIGPG